MSKKKNKKGKFLIQNSLDNYMTRVYNITIVVFLFLIFVIILGRILSELSIDIISFTIIGIILVCLFIPLCLWLLSPFAFYIKIYENGLKVRQQNLFHISIFMTKFFSFDKIEICDLTQIKVKSKLSLKRKKTMVKSILTIVTKSQERFEITSRVMDNYNEMYKILDERIS